MKKPSNPVLAVVWYAIFGTIVLMCSRSLTSGSQATPKSEDGLSQQEKDLNSRCAEAYLKLAQLNLQTARETNRQVPDTYSAGAILALEEMVAISEAAAREAQRGNGAIWRRVQIRGAERCRGGQRHLEAAPRRWLLRPAPAIRQLTVRR